MIENDPLSQNNKVKFEWLPTYPVINISGQVDRVSATVMVGCD